jgi:uncharacterized membrane protein
MSYISDEKIIGIIMPGGTTMANQTDQETMFLYVGAYATETSAKEDYDALLKLHKEGFVGSYDVGIVTKAADGKLDIARHTDSTGKGARRGLAVGVFLGIVFPPSILASGVVGAGAGAAIGHHFNEISKDDLKEIGDFLEDNEAALVIIGESQIQEMVNQAAKSALKEYKKEFNANAREFNRQIDQEIKAM